MNPVVIWLGFLWTLAQMLKLVENGRSCLGSMQNRTWKLKKESWEEGNGIARRSNILLSQILKHMGTKRMYQMLTKMTLHAVEALQSLGLIQM
jgi:hypothetical protein